MRSTTAVIFFIWNHLWDLESQASADFSLCKIRSA